MEYLQFPIYIYIVSCYLQIVTILLSFLIWLPFISFSCLIAVAARTFNTMLNMSGESEDSCFASDLGGNAFSFSPLSMILTVGLLFMALLC